METINAFLKKKSLTLLEEEDKNTFLYPVRYVY